MHNVGRRLTGSLVNYPKGFHDSKITCNATAIAAFIHRRLTLSNPSEA